MTTEMQVVVEKARESDAEALARASARAFHSDVDCGAPEIGGPPGYDSPAWQRRMMRMGDYYRIVAGGEVVGGMIVFGKAPRAYELGRIFVDPDVQNRGIGAQAMAHLWQAYPLAKRWTLDTPAWNVRTRHFYKKVGFREVAIHDGAVLFERRMPARAPRRQAASGKEGR